MPRTTAMASIAATMPTVEARIPAVAANPSSIADKLPVDTSRDKT